MDQMEKIAEREQKAREDVGSLQEVVTKQQKIIVEYRDKLDIMNQHLDSLEQYSRRNSIRITGLGLSAGPLDMQTVVNAINQHIKLPEPVTATEIDRAHLVGVQSSGDRPLLVKFATYTSKSRVLKEKSQLRGTSVFLSEDLTKRRAMLLWHCRQARKAGTITQCWTHDGTVLVKKDGTTTRIQCTNDLWKVVTVRPTSNNENDQANHPNDASTSD